METKIEYGLFNLLPDGMTIENISEPLKWLYTSPFQTHYSKSVLENRANWINKERAKHFASNDRYHPVTTYCEVREQTITYSAWRRCSD